MEANDQDITMMVTVSTHLVQISGMLDVLAQHMRVLAPALTLLAARLQVIAQADAAKMAEVQQAITGVLDNPAVPREAGQPRPKPSKDVH